MSLKISNVRKSYREPDGSTLTVLDVEHFELAEGEQVALFGESGGGKTTLLNAISGITPVDSGEIEVAGTKVTSLSEVARDRFRAEYIGFVFQSFNLLPAFTALENVLLGMAFSGRADRKLASELLEQVGLGDRANYRPAQLSVGQQQRVAVARALANRPRLMLADEPTASVDIANRDRVIDLIQSSCRDYNIALLVVTHSPESADRFERVERLEEFNRAARLEPTAD